MGGFFFVRYRIATERELDLGGRNWVICDWSFASEALGGGYHGVQEDVIWSGLGGTLGERGVLLYINE